MWMLLSQKEISRNVSINWILHLFKAFKKHDISDFAVSQNKHVPKAKRYFYTERTKKAQLQILHHKIKKKLNKNTKSPKNIIKPKHSPKYFHVQKKQSPISNEKIVVTTQYVF